MTPEHGSACCRNGGDTWHHVSGDLAELEKYRDAMESETAGADVASRTESAHSQFSCQHLTGITFEYL